MSINYPLILIISVIQFIVGAIWYMWFFGGLWERIHGFNELSAETQSEMRKGMLPYLLTQFGMTLVTNVALGLLIFSLKGSEWNALMISMLVWIGFISTTQVVTVIFGRDKKEWMITKIAVIVSHQFVNFLIAGAIYYYFL